MADVNYSVVDFNDLSEVSDGKTLLYSDNQVCKSDRNLSDIVQSAVDKQVENKLDTSAFSTVSGDFLTQQSLEGYATETWVNDQGFLTEHQEIPESANWTKSYETVTANSGTWNYANDWNTNKSNVELASGYAKVWSDNSATIIANGNSGVSALNTITANSSTWTKVTALSEGSNVQISNNNENYTIGVSGVVTSASDSLDNKLLVLYNNQWQEFNETGAFEVVALKDGYPDVQNPNTKVIYLTKENGSSKTDPFTEWIYSNNTWEIIGETTVDISGKLDKSIYENASGHWEDSYNVLTANSANGKWLTAHQSLEEYYTKSETSGSTEISDALDLKENKLSFGYDSSDAIISINNSAIGGGGNYTAGTNLEIVNNVIGVRTQDCTANSAYYAFVEGRKNKAEGQYSHAEGSETSARGDASHTEGYKTITNGFYAHAEGYETKAKGNESHAEGSATSAQGVASHAEGSETSAQGDASHTEGYKTFATASCSHAEGQYTRAFGNNSHSEGFKTSAEGNTTHAEGGQTSAYGQYSHAEGSETSAKGEASHAEGYKTFAAVNYTHSEGFCTRANGSASHAEGSGTSAIGQASHAEGGQTSAEGNASHAEGYQTSANGYCSHTEGSGTTAKGEATHAEGVGTSANGNASHAEGSGTKAYSDFMHVGGAYNYTTSNALFVLGNGTADTARSDAFIVDRTGQVTAAGNMFTSAGQVIATNSTPAAGNVLTYDGINNSAVWSAAPIPKTQNFSAGSGIVFRTGAGADEGTTFVEINTDLYNTVTALSSVIANKPAIGDYILGCSNGTLTWIVYSNVPANAVGLNNELVSVNGDYFTVGEGQ